MTSVAATRTLLWQAADYACCQSNPLQQGFYLLLVLGGYSAFLFSGAPRLPTASVGRLHVHVSVASAHSRRMNTLTPYVSFGVVAAALFSFISASTTAPGILLPQTLEVFDNYPYDGVLYSRRPCPTCRTTKLARSKHCSVCNVCVPRFDHHCGWLNSCIGERNHVAFLRFLAVNALLCVYGGYVLFLMLFDEYSALLNDQFLDETTGAVVQGDGAVVLRYLVHAEAALCVLFSMCLFMGTAVVCFLAFHCVLVATNTTTNEFFKRRSLCSRKAEVTVATKSSSGAATDDDAPARSQRTASQSWRGHAYDLGSIAANVAEIWNPRFLANLHQRRKHHSN